MKNPGFFCLTAITLFVGATASASAGSGSDGIVPWNEPSDMQWSIPFSGKQVVAPSGPSAASGGGGGFSLPSGGPLPSGGSLPTHTTAPVQLNPDLFTKQQHMPIVPPPSKQTSSAPTYVPGFQGAQETFPGTQPIHKPAVVASPSTPAAIQGQEKIVSPSPLRQTTTVASPHPARVGKAVAAAAPPASSGPAKLGGYFARFTMTKADVAAAHDVKSGPVAPPVRTTVQDAVGKPRHFVKPPSTIVRRRYVRVRRRTVPRRYAQPQYAQQQYNAVAAAQRAAAAQAAMSFAAGLVGGMVSSYQAPVARYHGGPIGYIRQPNGHLDPYYATRPCLTMARVGPTSYTCTNY